MFHPGSCHIYLKAVRHLQDSRTELGVTPHLSPMPFGKGASEPDAVSLDNDIHIQVLPLQDDIPYKASHEIRIVIKAVSYLSQIL